MRITFLGTRANVDLRKRQHRRHSALLVEHCGRMMIDCGKDWLGTLEALAPDAVLLTHAHPDHAWGLRQGAPCPVYGIKAALAAISGFPVATTRTVSVGVASQICGLTVEPFALIHSIRAPAVGYRITSSGVGFFYAPDVVDIVEKQTALARLDLYIGDGSTMTRPIVRRRGPALFGHTTIRAQLAWCGAAGIPLAIFTHCGSEILRSDERKLAAQLRGLARTHGVEARFAHDGLSIHLQPSRE